GAARVNRGRRHRGWRRAVVHLAHPIPGPGRPCYRAGCCREACRRRRATRRSKEAMHPPFRAFSVLALLLVPALPAQCTVTGAGMQTYGQGCNPVFGSQPTLAISLDASGCRLDITVQAFGGCCNTYLTNHLLALGAQQVNVPLPQIGSGCALLA